jgi:putative FmdB family regulatory protein
MPVYDFHCQKCEQRVEIEHRFDEPHPKKHRKCGGRLRRIFVSPHIVYKGAGFFSTDKRLDPTPEVE